MNRDDVSRSMKSTKCPYADSKKQPQNSERSRPGP
jgi:hypothetical protein